MTGFGVYGRESRVLGLELGGGSRIRIHLIEAVIRGLGYWAGGGSREY